MPKCRICGDEFKNSVYTGLEICGNSDCWSKAWREAVKPFRNAMCCKANIPVKRQKRTSFQKDK